jgi:hypothetical protein
MTDNDIFYLNNENLCRYIIRRQKEKAHMQTNTQQVMPGAQKPEKKKKKVLLIFILCAVIGLVAATGYLLRDTLYKAWIMRKDTVTINGIEVNEDTLSGLYTSDGNVPTGEDLWLSLPDAEKIRSQTGKQLDAFIKAAKAKNVGRMLRYISETEKEKYEELFTNNKDELDIIASLLEERELVFISDPIRKKTDTALRLAEYSVTYEGQSFSLVFVEEGGKWLIKSF